MKIKVKTNMNLPHWGGSIREVKLKNGNHTISDLIGEISKHINFPLINPRTKELSEFVELVINGKNYDLLPNYLEKEVRAEDEIFLKFLIMGGG